MNWKIPIWLLLILLYCHALTAQQNPHPHFRNYSTEQGLPSPEVYCAFQDSRGYMWFGTDNGAARFDGYTFRNYGAKDGLTSNVVFDIYEDVRGRVWLGTMTGEVFIWEGDTIVPYRFNHLVKQYEKRCSGVWLSHLQPEDETAYFEILEVGVMIIDSSGRDSLISSKLPRSRIVLELEGSPSSMYSSVAKREKEEGILGSILYEQKYKKVQFEIVCTSGRIQVDLPSKGSSTIQNIKTQRLSPGYLLIYFAQELYCLKHNQLLWHIPFDFGPEFKINEIVERDDGAIMFCMADGWGLRIYLDVEALRKGEFDLYLNGLSVSNAFQDATEGLWVTTQEEGVFYSPNTQLVTYDTRFGFSDDFVTAVAFKNEHELYAGCRNGDIFKVDLQSHQITEAFSTYYGYHNHDLLYQPETDLLWSNSAYRSDGEWDFVYTKRYPLTGKRYKYTPSKLEKLHINAAGDLLGCYGEGFDIIDIENDTVRYRTHNQVELRERTFGLHTDQQQRLWVGNARGLFEFRDSALISPGVDHPAFHIRVEDIHEFPDGSLVFGTKGEGVVCWWGEHLLQLTAAEGLTSNMIEDVQVDEKGVLWVGTLNGLNKITFDDAGEARVRTFTMANGLPSNEIYKIKCNKGQVWLCTSGGLVRFQEPEEETVATAPVIRHLKVNGDATSPQSDRAFSYRQNNLQFHFLSINYRQNGSIPYRYRLGKYDDWQYTENLTVNYPQLSPGDYQFEVQAQNQDGYWSDSSTYAFSIQPPWWNTWWARAVAGLLILAGVIRYQRQSVARVRKEAAIQQQVSDLERSALQAQMNPHFIFNCLNSIQNFILQNDQKQAVEYLSRFAQLVRHNLNASVEGEVSLEEEISLLDNYLSLERERFEQRFDYMIEVDDTLDQQFTAFPPLLIQPYVENAIIHGLSKKSEKGKVEVFFGRENGQLAVRIRDNGPGYQTDRQKPKNSQHKSVGMTITQKRLEMLSNSPEAVQIATLNGSDDTSGTEVKILIDLN